MKFYLCERCGNIIEKITDAGIPVMCCGQKMTELVAGTKDASREKHVPSYKVEGQIVSVQVGVDEHVMQPEHYIEWVAVETEQGIQRKHLHPGEKPVATFALIPGDKVVAVYEYCNLHGLWKA